MRARPCRPQCVTCGRIHTAMGVSSRAASQMGMHAAGEVRTAQHCWMHSAKEKTAMQFMQTSKWCHHLGAVGQVKRVQAREVACQLMHHIIRRALLAPAPQYKQESQKATMCTLHCEWPILYSRSGVFGTQ